jgi:hypothetical protein
VYETAQKMYNIKSSHVFSGSPSPSSMILCIPKHYSMFNNLFCTSYYCKLIHTHSSTSTLISAINCNVACNVQASKSDSDYSGSTVQC